VSAPIDATSTWLCKFADEQHGVRECLTHPGGAISEDYYNLFFTELDDGQRPGVGPLCSRAPSENDRALPVAPVRVRSEATAAYQKWRRKKNAMARASRRRNRP